ncbi:hypothetical protein [Acinetobacter haemolyticus]|nr:hypothetical protein [Acinetobacter haemolyticus]
MLKTIFTLGAGVAIGCYLKSNKTKISDAVKHSDEHLSEQIKGRKNLNKD